MGVLGKGGVFSGAGVIQMATALVFTDGGGKVIGGMQADPGAPDYTAPAYFRSLNVVTGAWSVSNGDGTWTVEEGSTGTFEASAGTVAAPSYTFALDTDTGWYNPAANVVGLALGGVASLKYGSGSAPTNAAATDTAGADVYINAPSAGASATTAKAGAALEIDAGAGSVGTTTVAGGAGGNRVDSAGAGGAKTGTGHAAGGAGGTRTSTGGAGGNTASNGADAGGAGGAHNIVGGAGGNATAGTGNGGVGGDVNLTGGAGGTSAGGAAGAHGTAVATTGLLVGTTSATAITAARTMLRADSGGVFSAAQSSAYTITAPTPGGAASTGAIRYLFYLTAPGAFDISIVATGCTFVGTIVNDVTSVLPATGSTLKFASGAAALGDSIELIAISATIYLVRAVSSAAGGITIS
jgi:hypothetical protein